MFGFVGALQVTSIPSFINLEIKQCISSFDAILNEIDQKSTLLMKERLPFRFPSVYHPFMASLIAYSDSLNKDEVSGKNKDENSKLYSA